MDISQYNTRVVQEPRGMIRIITLIFAILAFATTSGFDTKTSLKLTCISNKTKANAGGGVMGEVIFKYSFPVEYPFKFDGIKITVNSSSCSDPTPETHDYSKIDFSSSAQFYVATGVLAFLYSTAILVLYVFGTRHYESNPLVPVVDLGVTVVLTIFWLAGSCAWAAGVSDVKHYTAPEYIWSFWKFCEDSNAGDGKPGFCLNTNPGKFTSLNISLIFGFANIFLWAASAWFVFKETQFHQKQLGPDQLGAPGQQGFDSFGGQIGGQMGGQMGGQQQMPGQTHFPQQRQFSDGY